jgi:hypothetical protein
MALATSDLLRIALIVGLLGWSIYTRYTGAKKGVYFHSKNREEVLYRESMVSGLSRDGVMGSLGMNAARSCLNVTITQDDIYIAVLFPFWLFAACMGLERRIRKRDIISLLPRESWFGRERLQIIYRSDDGKQHTFELCPHNASRFHTAASTGRSDCRR